MEAVHAMNQSGGWPMTIIMTPDGKPFFAATYIPKEPLIQTLHQVHQVWTTERESIERAGQQLVDWLQKDRFERAAGPLSEEILKTFHQIFMSQYDSTYGGRRGAPKFPPSFEMRSLLRVFKKTGDVKALEAVKLTLNQMARGGIYDHLVGGFHRYSTDEKWLVPHFEKMLYDQATLVRVYLEALQVTGDKEYEKVVRETLDYILREMTHVEGGFFSAEDADSERREGKFCVWSWGELQQTLTNGELSELIDFYGVTKEGSFESCNILHLQGEKLRSQRSETLLSALEKLRQIRGRRRAPFKDEKVLTSWNGLMISAMAAAGGVLNEGKYVRAAQKATDFILSYNVDTDGEKLLRLSLNKKAQSLAQLEDYTHMIDALIEVYQVSFDETYLLKAQSLQGVQDLWFSDKKSATYYSTNGEDTRLIVRPREFYDSVIPSGNSMALYNLLRLSQYFPQEVYRERASQFMKAFPKAIVDQPVGYVLLSVDWLLAKPCLLVLTGKKSEVEKRAREVAQKFNPYLLKAWSGSSQLPVVKDKPFAEGYSYLCREGSCESPLSESDLENLTSCL